MVRNLDHRAGVLCPVLDRTLLEYLREIVLGAHVRGTDRAAILNRDGENGPATRDTADRFSAQDFLLTRHTTDDA